MANTYAISGSGGFIGNRLKQILENEGNLVWGIPTDYLNSVEKIRKWLTRLKPDYIIHCAAWGNHSTQNSLRHIYESNVFFTINLLEASKKIDYKKLVLVGSSSEYGNPVLPMREDDLPLTYSYYGASKVAQTFLGRAFAYNEDKPIITVRPFSVYGPGEAAHRFIPTVINSIKNQTTFELAREPVHDWIYIDDFCEGLIAVSEVHSSPGEVYNLGTGLQYDNAFVVETLEEIMGKTAPYTTVKFLREFDTNFKWRADITKTKSIWESKIKLIDGLKKTYEYYK